VEEDRHYHLGFVTDSVRICYLIFDEKWEKVRLTFQAVGRALALRVSHGNIVLFLSWSLQHQFIGSFIYLFIYLFILSLFLDLRKTAD
jgi:hypothetical protein